MIGLKKNQKLVYAGETALRAPDGTPLPSVPQYMIVNVEEADPAAVATVKKNDRIILAGRIFNHKQKAEERFAAMKAGREIPPKEENIPLYILTDAENVNPKTGLLYETEKACALAAKDLAALIAIQKRKEKALERQGKTEVQDGKPKI